MKKTLQYWRISPGANGYLWREQKLHECIALGWNDVGNATSISRKAMLAWFEKKRSKQAYNQLDDFVHEVEKGDKLVASASAKGVFAVGTVIGDYEFNRELEYKHASLDFHGTEFA